MILINIANFISRTDFIICWVIAMSLLYIVSRCLRSEQLEMGWQHWISYILAAVSIIGGINALLTNIHLAHSENSQYNLNCIYNCIGGIAVIFLAIKNFLIGLGIVRIFNLKLIDSK